MALCALTLSSLCNRSWALFQIISYVYIPVLGWLCTVLGSRNDVDPSHVRCTVDIGLVMSLIILDTTATSILIIWRMGATAIVTLPMRRAIHLLTKLFGRLQGIVCLMPAIKHMGT